MTSIALPAIGAGGLGYPHDVVAKTMVDEIREFRRQHPTSGLDVTIIVRVEDASVIQVVTSFDDWIAKLQSENCPKIFENIKTLDGLSPYLPTLHIYIGFRRLKVNCRRTKILLSVCCMESEISSHKTTKINKITNDTL